MKKFLSLVLALVMTMSLVTVSAGAEDFTDDSSITYEEAVDVMSAVGVIDGYTDGSFQPTTNLTRGAAAKIICNLILGPTTAAALGADTAPYSDVPTTNVFAGYIAYCQKEGIISGYADGTFRPAAPLTGYAFLKMLLGALGYDSAKEGYTGANWSVNVAKQAIAIGLDEGNDEFVGQATVNREEAMLYAFNTMKADMVAYGSDTTISIGDATVAISGKAEKVPYSDSKDYRESIRDTSATDGYQQFCEAYFPNLKLEDVSGDVDDFGRPAATWYVKNDKVGTYAKEATLTYTTDFAAKDLYKDLDASRSYTYDVCVNSQTPTYTLTVNKTSSTKLSAVVSPEDAGNGSLIQVYEDEGVITVINTYLMQVAADYDTKNEELDLQEIQVSGNDIQNYPTWNSMTLSSDDFAGLEDYAEDDYVIVTVADGDIMSIAPAEVVTGEMTEYVHTESVTIGEEYEYAATGAAAITSSAWALGEDYNVYVDPYGYALWVDGVSLEDQYVFISEFSRHSTATKASVNAYGYFADGVEKEMTITKIDGTKVYGGDVSGVGYASTCNSEVTGWYTYVEKSGSYELTYVSDTYGKVDVANNTEVLDYSKNHTVINDGTNTKLGTSETVFVILKANGDVVVYTGIKNVPDITAAAASSTDMWMTYDGRYAEYVFIDQGNASITGGSNSSDTIFFYDLKNAGNDADDDNYYTYKAVVNGEDTTIRVSQDEVPALLYGVYTNVQKNDKDYVVGATIVDVSYATTNRDEFTYDAVSGTVVTLSNKTIVIDGVDYFMADSCPIFVFDGTELETYTAKELAYNDLDHSDYKVIGQLNADGEHNALYLYR